MDEFERVMRAADELDILEMRAWNSLDAVMQTVPEGMRQRLLRRACERYGVTG